MRARFRSWWQQIKKHPVATVLITLLAVVIVLVVLVILGYIFNWDWTGLTATDKSKPTTNIIIYQPGKTLWDWLGLLGVLAIPVVVGLFTFQQGRASDKSRQHQKETELEIATDYQREQALQAYIDKISELLLKEHLGERTADGELKPEGERARMIARVQTITVLTQLDGKRVGYVFSFLREAGLMSAQLNDSVVSLNEADIRNVNWSQANLYQANLSGANLYQVNLSGARLIGANLSEARIIYSILSNVNLSNANLTGTDLTGTNLKNAKNITTEELEKQTKLLKAAIMPDGKIYRNSSGAIMYGSKLSGFDLSGVNLSEADLRGSILTSVNLHGANLSNADLSGVNLSGAIGYTTEQLNQAKSLKDATMPDGSIHP